MARRRGTAPLLKIGEVARRAGVPVATVKHYVREGLLPVARKTHRNMAYYAPEAVDRIRIVKELQGKRFLPLRVIKAIFRGAAAREERAFETLRSTLSEAAELALAGTGEPLERGRAAAVARVSRAELKAMERARLVSARRPGEAYAPLDARLLALVGELRAAGFTRGRGFGVEALSMYKRAVERLAAEEVGVFLSRVIAKVPPRVAATMVAAAIDRVPELLALLRRKALSREIAALREATEPRP